MPTKGSYVRVGFIDPRSPQHQRPYGRVNDQIHDRDGLSCSPIPFEIRSGKIQTIFGFQTAAISRT